MISVEDWAEIRRLHRAEGLPIRQIARMMKVSRNPAASAAAHWARITALAAARAAARSSAGL